MRHIQENARIYRNLKVTSQSLWETRCQARPAFDWSRRALLVVSRRKLNAHLLVCVSRSSLGVGKQERGRSMRCANNKSDYVNLPADTLIFQYLLESHCETPDCLHHSCLPLRLCCLCWVKHLSVLTATSTMVPGPSCEASDTSSLEWSCKINKE